MIRVSSATLLLAVLGAASCETVRVKQYRPSEDSTVTASVGENSPRAGIKYEILWADKAIRPEKPRIEVAYTPTFGTGDVIVAVDATSHDTSDPCIVEHSLAYNRPGVYEAEITVDGAHAATRKVVLLPDGGARPAVVKVLVQARRAGKE